MGVEDDVKTQMRREWGFEDVIGKPVRYSAGVGDTGDRAAQPRAVARMLSEIANLAGYGRVEPWPGVVEAVRRITDSHAELVREREALESENARLRALVEEAYREGWMDAAATAAPSRSGWDTERDADWDVSDARAALDRPATDR